MSLPTRVPASLAVLTTALSVPVFGETGPFRELPEGLLEDLARRSRIYLEHAPTFRCVETVRDERYRQARRFTDERRYLVEPGGLRDGADLPEFRFEVKPKGRVRRRPSKRFGRFPSTTDWARLFSEENQPWFLYRDLGVRVEGFDWVRAIGFRGWFPLDRGRDIREWEGTALVEVTRRNLVEVRARPLNQEARLAVQLDRWKRALKIRFGLSAGPFFLPFTTFRLARRPLAHEVVVRFDRLEGDLRLPSLLRYDTTQAVSREETVPWSSSTRRYGRCRVGGS